ncbi:MAG: hypothetical protein R2748_04190 [Bryobacterales bacterium]
MRLFWLFLLLAAALPGQSDAKVVLVITADQTDWLLAAGGTVAAMIDDGAEAHLVRVGNDDKDSWNLCGRDGSTRHRRIGGRGKNPRRRPRSLARLPHGRARRRTAYRNP